MRLSVVPNLRRWDVNRRAKRPRGAAWSSPAELTAHPEDSRPAQLGAGVLRRLGEIDRAREWLARAVAIDPDDTNTQIQRGMHLSQLGDIEVALDLLERTLPKLGPGGRNWAKHDSDFEPLRNHPRFQQLFDRIDKG